MPKVDYSKDQPERFLRGIENQEKQIKDVSNQLVGLLSTIGGVDESMIEDIKSKVSKCLQTRKKSEQELDAEKIRGTYDELNSLHDQYKKSYNKSGEQLDENPKITKEIKEFCTHFKRGILGVSDKDFMVDLLKHLIETGQLEIVDYLGKRISLDCLNYDIHILDLRPHTLLTPELKAGDLNPAIEHLETDKKGMIRMSEFYGADGRRVPSQSDVQNILKSLSDNYPLISGRQGDIHDEDIAFFMLMTQSDGEFLLKKDRPLGKNRVLKCYHDFRGFKDMRFNSTGQIMLIREKK